MNYYKRHLGDYAKKCGRLSMLQHGAYTLLLDSCYDREQFPTIDDAIEWTWASTTDEIEAVTFVLRKFFVLENGLYVQKRVQEELAEYRAKSEINRRIAIERETNRKSKSTNRANTVNGSSPNHKPLTINQEPIEKNKDTAASDGVNVCERPDKPTRSKPPAVPLDYSAWPEQPSESVLTDWIAARKAKKLPVNQTVITRLGNELTRAVSAGLRVDDCLAEAVTRGWQGFKSEWMTNNRGDQHENRRSNSNGFNAIDPNDESWLTDDALAYIESGREIGNRVRAGKPLLRRDDDGVYRLATGDDG